jgi:hypothetical protein
MRFLLIALSLVPLLAGEALALPGDPLALQGALEWPAVLGAERFIVVKADDGSFYYADIAGAQRRGPLKAGDRMSLIGVEGARPYEVAAVVVGAGDAAIAGLPPVPSPRSGSAAPTPTAPSAAGPPPSAPPPPNTASPLPSSVGQVPAPPSGRQWRRVDGKVQALSGGSLTVRAGAGESVTVDSTQLSPNLREMLKPGDDITVFAEPRTDGKLVAVGFIQNPAPATLPRGAR